MRLLLAATLLAATTVLAAPAHAQDVACTRPIPADPPPPSQESYLRIAQGEGVRVAVIDTGIAPHPDLGPVEAVTDLVTPWTPDPLFDCDGHGTIVAGVIHSVAPGAQLLSIRQSSAHYRDTAGESGTLDTLTAGIHAALDADARVINISVVSCLDPHVLLDARPLTDALQRAEDSGVVVVAAAGNNGGPCQPGMVVHPAHEETVLAVAATDPADPHGLAGYVLAGGDVAASGVVPVALSHDGVGWSAGTTTAQGQQVVFEGTSFAAPYVTGVAALLRQRHPEDSAAQLRERIRQAAQPGHGVVDAHTSLTHLAADYAVAGREVRVEKQETTVSAVPQRAGLVLGAALLAALLIGLGRAGWRRA